MADAIDALYDDVPARLRADLGRLADKHTLAPSSEEPPSQRLRSDAYVPDTSEAFAFGWSDGWDLDDAQLYSEESLLLTTDAPASSPVPPADSLRQPPTSAQALQAFLEALVAEQDECGPDAQDLAMVARAGAEVVMLPGTVAQLHGVLGRCVRDTERALADQVVAARTQGPQLLLDLDMTLVQRLLSILSATLLHSTGELRSDMDLDKMAAPLAASTTALLCVRCSLSIMSLEELPKYVFNEELLGLCVDTLKALMEQFVLPVAEACAAPSPACPVGLALVAREAGQLAADLDAHLRLFCAALTQLERLFRSTHLSMPDAITIRCVYMALAPFYASEMRTTGERRASPSLYATPQALRPVRLACLNVLRNVFAHYPDQRAWVLTEILTSLHRLPDLRQRKRSFRLPQGRSVYIVTALLLQLVQAAAFITPSDKEQSLAWFEEAAQRASGTAPPCQTHQETVHGLAHSIAQFLLTRVGDPKSSKAPDTSVAHAMYGMVDDLLAILYLPEWPAAPVLLVALCQQCQRRLSEPKAPSDAKGLALDLLGTAASHIWQTEQELHARRTRMSMKIMAMAQICARSDVDGLQMLSHAYGSIIHRLRAASKDDPSARAAAVFYEEQYLLELALAMRAVMDRATNTEQEDQVAELRSLEQALVLTARVFTKGPVPSAKVDASVVPLLTLRSAYFVRYTTLLTSIVAHVHATSLSVRTKSLRALHTIANVHMGLLDSAPIRDAVVRHISDPSAAVREISVAVVSSYVLTHPDQLSMYFKVLAERVFDIAVAVRKRAVKFLRDVYLNNPPYATKLTAVLYLLRCMHDVDKSVHGLAQEALADAWFDQHDEAPTTIAQLLADVGTRLQERPSPLDEFLRRLGQEHEARSIVRKLGILVDELVSGLFTENMPSTAICERLHVVQILATAHPSVVTVSRAKQLMPYLDGAQDDDEIRIMEALLRVLMTCLPKMPRTARSFALELEQLLTRLISRCTLRPGSTTLEALVKTFCLNLEWQTQSFDLLKKVYGALLSRFDDASGTAGSFDASHALALNLTALLCAFAPWQKAQMDNALTHVLGHLVKLARSDHDPLRLSALTALGYVLQAHPAHFLDNDVAEIVQAVFDHGGLYERHVVLRSLLAYLERDAVAEGASTDDVRLQLKGQAWTDAGLPSALLQRYAGPVLAAVLELRSPGIQRTATEILSMSVLQGLSHPMQCVPVLVALETGEDVFLRSRAVQLHRHLVAKHASLLSTRYSDAVRAAFSFQRRMVQAPRGARNCPHSEAQFQIWYDLISERRQSRSAFLRAMVRLLDVDADTICTEDQVALALFVADNLCLLDFRVAEEPLLVLHELTLLQASSGLQVSALVQRRVRAEEHRRAPSPLTDEESDSSSSQESGSTADDSENDEDSDGDFSVLAKHTLTPSRKSTRHRRATAESTPGTASPKKESDPNVMLKHSTWMSLACAVGKVDMWQRLRRHLKQLYKLSEEKCRKYDPDTRSSAHDRPITKAAVSQVEQAMLPWTWQVPNTDDAAYAYLQEWVEAEDEAESESDVDYE